MKQEFHVKQKFCLVNSYRNTISKWALGFRYRNFFIPRVEKNLKISPWEGNSNLPRAYGPWEDRVSSLGLIFGGFFNPWDEEISIPETRPIRKSYILPNYEQTNLKTAIVITYKNINCRINCLTYCLPLAWKTIFDIKSLDGTINICIFGKFHKGDWVKKEDREKRGIEPKTVQDAK